MLRRTVSAALPLLLSPLLASAATVCSVESGAKTVPLVELYTSEGCSDCPPADRWLSEIAAREDGEANFLAFHVDYWDAIGWPDRFASKLHTQRQQLRVSRTGKRVVYTPQVMIGEATTVGWRGGRSAGGEVGRLLDAARSRDATVRLRMSHVVDDGDVMVTLEVDDAGAGADEAWVWLAAYEDGLVSAIAAGENEGRELHHDRVVRALQGPWMLGQAPIKVRLALPQDADPQRTGLVAFVESPATGAALQSLGTRLTSCAAVPSS